MKAFKFAFLIMASASLIFFANCGGNGGGDDEPTEREQRIALITDHQWSLSSIVLPDVNATEEAEWDNFTVSFSSSNMTTNGYPAGAQAVWPSGTWSLSDNLNTITRQDGVVMNIVTLTESAFTVSFTLPDQDIGGSRIAALGGDYTFNLE